MIISSRTKTIIEFLISAEDYLTIKDIAGRLNLGERTVYREMDNVNDTLGHYSLFVESIKSKGVRLYGSAEDIDHLKKSLNDNKAVYDYNFQERIETILFYLLHEKDFIKTRLLSIKLQVSMQTIRNDLQHIENTIKIHDLKLEKKKGLGILISGNTISRNHLLVNLLMRNIDIDVFLKWIKNFNENNSLFIKFLIEFGYENIIKKSYTVVNNLINEKNIQLTDVEFQELIFLLTMFINNRDNYILEPLNFEETFYNKNLTEKIKVYIENIFNINLTGDDIKYLKWIVNLISNHNIKSIIVDKNELSMAKKINNFIELVEASLKVNLRNDSTLAEGLVGHIDRALIRIRSGISVSNPINSEIKNRYEELYRVIRQSIDEVFQDDLFPEDEIGYLVLYFVVSLDKMAVKSIKVLVVCSSGMGSSKMLSSRLEREIPEITVRKIIALISLPKENLNEYDIVISTIPLDLQTVPHMMVSPLLNKEEINRLKHRIITLEEKKYQLTDKIKIIKAEERDIVDEIKKIRLFSHWALELINGFKVEYIEGKDRNTDILEIIDKDLFNDKIIPENAVYEHIKNNEKISYFQIPNTKIDYLDCSLEKIKQPVFRVYHLDFEGIFNFNNKELSDIEAFVIMIYPKNHNKLLLNLLSFITMSIIENNDTIRNFENGNENKIKGLLNEKIKLFLKDHF